MNRLSLSDRARILHMLLEGSGMRATARMADVSINTVVKLLVDTGNACKAYHDAHVTNITSDRIQIDEIWSFCHAKRHNLPAHLKGIQGFGDVWTYTAIDPDTKLIPCWRVGDRDSYNAHKFIRDLHSRLSNRVQLTSDGYLPYLNSVERYFGADVDFGQLVNFYGDEMVPEKESPRHKFKEAKVTRISGNPDDRHISTAMVERFNLTMRTSIKRFARKTTCHSKKMENHAHAVCIYVFYYNWVRIHSTLRVTPAMAAGLTEKVWSLEEMVGLVQ